MAVHLLLLAVETVLLGLSGCAMIYSDCLGDLYSRAELPPIASRLDAGIQTS